MPRHVTPSDLFLIVLFNLWPPSLSTDRDLKSTLRLVCSDTCAIIDDLQRCVSAQLQVTVRGCHLSAFRRIEHLRIHGTLAPQLRQLGRVLQGLTSRLVDVTSLDLNSVLCLSGECSAAVATCMPRLAHLTILDARADGLAPDLNSDGLPPPPSPPDQSFYTGLSALPHLATLCGASPTTDAHIVALGALTRLTCLQLRGDLSARLDLQPLGRLVHLRVLHLQLDTIHPAGPPSEPPADIAWVSSLVLLEELRGCPAPGVAGVRALQACPRLSCLSVLDLFERGWEAAAPPAAGAAPSLCLPSLHELHFVAWPFVDDLAGFLRVVRLPVLEVMDSALLIGEPDQGDAWVRDAEAVVRGMPLLSRFAVQMDPTDFDDDSAWQRWAASVRASLAGLQALFALEKRRVEWVFQL